MTHDVVKELGFLTLGTRFKRIGESLQAQALLASSGMDMPAGHFPAAVAQAGEPLEGSLLGQLAALEAALQRTPLLQRAAAATAARTSSRRRPAR